jgi:hypothetical protein
LLSSTLQAPCPANHPPAAQSIRSSSNRAKVL